MATLLATRCMVGWATREKHLLSRLRYCSPISLDCKHGTHGIALPIPISDLVPVLLHVLGHLTQLPWAPQTYTGAASLSLAVYQQIKHPCFKNAAESMNNAGQSCMWELFCLTSCSDCSVKHIPGAAQHRSCLPQGPCKHPGQPAVSQLELESH